MTDKFSYTCLVCGTTLEGPLGLIFHLFGIRRSVRNPNICNRCDAHMQEGRVIELSVLFADLMGFTEMTNRIGADRSYEVVDAFFKMANGILVKNDAFIDKYIGDAVMALFNAPIRNAQHAKKAVSAAVEIHDGLKFLSLDFDLDLQARIGVASGYARVGRLGSTDRKDYTAIGDAVNLASRLEAFAAPGEIVVDKNAFIQMATDYPNIKPEMLEVRGFAEPIQAYRLGDASQASVPLPTQPDLLIHQRNASFGAILFAIFGAPCAAVTILSPLAIFLGLTSLMGSIAPVFGFLDSTPVRIPLQLLALVGAIVNLYVIWYGNSRRKKNESEELTRLEKRKVSFVIWMSIVSLAAIAFETYAHIVIEGNTLF